MGDHKYILEKGSKKHNCPQCGKKRFVRYINNFDKSYLPTEYGRCDRESNCGYHFNPYLNGYVKSIDDDNTHRSSSTKRKLTSDNSVTNQISYIESDIVKQSRKLYNQNNFTIWLNKVVGSAMASKAISRYHIGTSKHWPGATIFWQIDRCGNVRSGKIMLYDKNSGHRIKKPFPHINWVHVVASYKSFNLHQCFFGEHLLNDNLSSPVGIVESEKTAIVASVYLPHLVWLAAGSLSNLTIPKFEVLKNRKVFLFPDHKGYEKWTAKANQIRLGIPGIHIIVSNLIEKVARGPDNESGFDLADYLTKYDFHDFTSIQKSNQGSVEPGLCTVSVKPMLVRTDVISNELTAKLKAPSQTNEPEAWPVNELEMFFKENKLPDSNIKLDSASTIIDIHKFLSSHLEILKVQNGNPLYRPYINRLNQLKEHILLFHNLAPKPITNGLQH